MTSDDARDASRAPTERTLNDAEVDAIFARAAQPRPSSPRHTAADEGMTLAELQDIGREVGIAPDQIAHAARMVVQDAQSTRHRFLGLPLGVGLSVELDRTLSEDEWNRLVVDLRETFDARGKVSQEGAFRQWTNGNLQALVEPTPRGHRVRFRTMKSDARAMLLTGSALTLTAATLLITAVARGATGDAGMMSALSVLATVGAGMFGLSALRLPGWARLRRRQMEDIAERLTKG